MPSRKLTPGAHEAAPATLGAGRKRFARSADPATVPSSPRDPQPLQVCAHVLEHDLSDCPAPLTLSTAGELEAWRTARRILADPTSDWWIRTSASAGLAQIVAVRASSSHEAVDL